MMAEREKQEPQAGQLLSQSLLQEQLHREGLELTGNRLVRWKADAANHPQNWVTKRKAYDIAIVIFLDFFITAIGNVGGSAAEHARQEYHVGNVVALLAFTSMYLLGQAVGGVIFPPYSESFGRKKLYLSSTVLFSLFNILIAGVRSIAAVFVGRFITGFLSAIPSIVVVGSIEDLFDAKARVWFISVWLIVANFGLVVGPIFAAYVSALIGWRWIFYVTAVIAGVASLLLLATKESRASQLLERRICAIRKVTGDHSLQIETADHPPNLGTFLRVTVFRPLRFLFTEPIVSMISLMSAIAFGLIYLFTEVLPIVYGSYGFTDQQTSLAFVPIGVGFLCTFLIRLYDRGLIEKRRRSGQPLSPEDKLTGFAIAAPALAIGLWWFAWTVPPAARLAPWIASMLALIPIGFAINEFDCVLVGYLTDSYTTFASSAYASLSLLRSVFSAVFPLFARQLYTALDANHASTILAAVATVACVSPILLVKYGKRLRQSSTFARLSLPADGSDSEDGGRTDGNIDILVRVDRD